MVAAGLLVAGLVVLYIARNALPLVALAGLFAFLVAPVVRFAVRVLRLPRGVALIMSYVLVFLATLLIGILVANGILNSISEIDPPKTIEALREAVLSSLDSLESISLLGYTFDLGEVVSPLRDQLAALEQSTPSESAADAAEATENRITVGQQQASLLIGGALVSLRTVGGIVSALLISSLLTVMMALYLNLDGHKFASGARSYIPAEYLPEVTTLGRTIDGIWKGYLYGQLLNSLATGILVWLALYALGLPGAFALGVIMALLNMIPTFGPILAAVPGVLSAFALGSTRLDMSNVTFALLIVAVYVLVVQLQANVMAPFITGRAVRMLPVSILIGLIVGVQVAGLIGALLAVPVMASGKEIVKYLMAKLLDRPPYPELLLAQADVPAVLADADAAGASTAAVSEADGPATSTTPEARTGEDI